MDEILFTLFLLFTVLSVMSIKDQGERMKVYDKNDVDVTFSNCFMDLEQLTSFDAIPLDKVKEARKEIQKYEADCLVLEDRPICHECNETMFKSIYHIIDKLIESED